MDIKYTVKHNAIRLKGFISIYTKLALRVSFITTVAAVTLILLVHI